MGVLRWGSPELAWEIDDRTLAHLAVVIFDKLHRGELLRFSFQSSDGPTTLWLSQRMPLRFDFENSAVVSINRDWVRLLESTAQSSYGLRVVPEPRRGAPVTSG